MSTMETVIIGFGEIKKMMAWKFKFHFTPFNSSHLKLLTDSPHPKLYPWAVINDNNCQKSARKGYVCAVPSSLSALQHSFRLSLLRSIKSGSGALWLSILPPNSNSIKSYDLKECVRSMLGQSNFSLRIYNNNSLVTAAGMQCHRQCTAKPPQCDRGSAHDWIELVMVRVRSSDGSHAFRIVHRMKLEPEGGNEWMDVF